VLRKILTQQEPKTTTDIENILLRFYRLGVLTKDEDDILRLKGLSSKMPMYWDTTENVFSRYEVAGIKGKLFNK
jgi:hypothetical protein